MLTILQLTISHKESTWLYSSNINFLQRSHVVSGNIMTPFPDFWPQNFIDFASSCFVQISFPRSLKLWNNHSCSPGLFFSKGLGEWEERGAITQVTFTFFCDHLNSRYFSCIEIASFIPLSWESIDRKANRGRIIGSKSKIRHAWISVVQ